MTKMLSFSQMIPEMKTLVGIQSLMVKLNLRATLLAGAMVGSVELKTIKSQTYVT